ncbi:MAG TPA: response regulator [Ktedonobacterales bacterium]|nr:response regulator [Ktedonobacterales bacterium]
MHPQTVLIIEDEESIRSAVHTTLEECGYAVLEAPDGRTGLDLLCRQSDRLVVLLDLMLPTLSGLKLLQAVGRDPDLAARHVFILFTAARAFTAQELRSYLPNRRLLSLPKPFSIEQLIAIVEEAAQETVREGAEVSAGEPPDGAHGQHTDPRLN